MAVAHDQTTVRALNQRGFVVQTAVEYDPGNRPAPTRPAAVAVDRPTRDPSTDQSGVVDDIPPGIRRCWLDAVDHPVRPVGPLRAAVNLARGFTLASAARTDPVAPAAVDGPVAVCVVFAVTGWTVGTARAVQAALDAVVELGPAAHLVLVQNDTDAVQATRDWTPERHRQRLRRAYGPNRGYGPACNLGARSARPGTDWLLYTQEDVQWSSADVRLAVAYALWGQWATGATAPALVGPSGGYVDTPTGIVTEYGTNAGDHVHSARVVDFLAGYWVLVSSHGVGSTWRWCEDFFLYYEDVDLGLVHAALGAPSLVVPGLRVRHRRGGTIAPALGHGRFVVQAESRRRFLARWSPAPAGTPS